MTIKIALQKHFRFLLLALIATLQYAPSPVVGATPQYTSFNPTTVQIRNRMSQTYKGCLKTSGGVTATMRNCSSAEAARQEYKLKTAYSAVLRRMTKGNIRDAFVTQQRHWLGQREALCRKEMQKGGGGTAGLLIADACGLNELIRRTLWFEIHHP